MIILVIKDPVQFKLRKYTETDFNKLPVGTTFSQFMGDHPSNAEQGSVIIDVSVLEGSLEDITDILFIQGDSYHARLIGYKKKIFGGYRIEVQFDTVFKHGLKYMTEYFISRDHGIVGLTPGDAKALHSISGQRELLEKLTRLILPGKFKEIVNLAIPALSLISNTLNDPGKSHFVGLPKLPAGTGIPTTIDNQELFHLLTLRADEIPQEVGRKGIDGYLSFYLDVMHSVERWPDRDGDFKVFNYSHGDTGRYTHELPLESEINFDMHMLLGIPRSDHSASQCLHLDEEQEAAYEALYDVYKKLLPGDEYQEEQSRLFGYPDSIQNCASFEAERLKSGKDYPEVSFEDAKRWKLLLQISPYSGTFRFFEDFGDGTIYFMIREDDLAAGNFNDIQVVVQNT